MLTSISINYVVARVFAHVAANRLRSVGVQDFEVLRRVVGEVTFKEQLTTEGAHCLIHAVANLLGVNRHYPTDRGLHQLLGLDSATHTAELKLQSRDATRLEIHTWRVTCFHELIK